LELAEQRKCAVSSENQFEIAELARERTTLVEVGLGAVYRERPRWFLRRAMSVRAQRVFGAARQ
jgi:hypothetical protein